MIPPALAGPSGTDSDPGPNAGVTGGGLPNGAPSIGRDNRPAPSPASLPADPPGATGATTSSRGRARPHLTPQQRVSVLFAAGAVIALAQLVVLAGRLPGGEDAPSAVAQRSQAVAGAVAAVRESLAPAASLAIGDLARSVVLIQAVTAEGHVACTGSGTVMSADGLVLTNAHVVRDAGPCDYERLIVAVTDGAEQPPAPRYGASVVAYDAVLDLAVLHLGTTAEGAPAGPLDLVPIPTGDSDQVALGQPIRLLGYPGIGGDTITYTAGSVAGFVAQEGLGDRAWIKTDATVAGGNSGGMAIDAAGALIGVPTQVTAGDHSDVADCRVVQDTDGDGTLTDVDACIPVGGFINSLRPINLARPLLDHAQHRQVVAPEVLQAP